MIRLSNFTPRMWLILVHDLVVTAVAVLASFFIRFEEGGIIQRWQLLATLLPPFVVFAGVVYLVSGLYKSKWRVYPRPVPFSIIRPPPVFAGNPFPLHFFLPRA